MRYKDISGTKFGELTAVRPTDRRSNCSVVWQFKCSCNNIVYRSLRSVSSSVHSGHNPSCGCTTRNDYSHLIGTKSGKLTVKRIEFDKNIGSVCVCECECGNYKRIDSDRFASGSAKSCSHKCRPTNPKLDVGESSANNMYAIHRNYAGYRDMPWNLSYEEFRYLTQQPCIICGQIPNIKWDSCIDRGMNGSYVHNKIAYIDSSLGYTVSNMITLCKKHATIARSLRRREKSIRSMLQSRRRD